MLAPDYPNEIEVHVDDFDGQFTDNRDCAIARALTKVGFTGVWVEISYFWLDVPEFDSSSPGAYERYLEAVKDKPKYEIPCGMGSSMKISDEQPYTFTATRVVEEK